MQERSNRVRIFRFDDRYIIDMLSDHRNRGSYFCALAGVPNDANLLSVMHDFRSRGFAILVEHHTFDEVEVGMEAPCDDLHFHTLKYVMHPVGLLDVAAEILSGLPDAAPVSDWMARYRDYRDESLKGPAIPRPTRYEALAREINRIRNSEEGASIEILCDNPDFSGPASAVRVRASWASGGFDEGERFSGDSIEEAVMLAGAAMDSKKELPL